MWGQGRFALLPRFIDKLLSRFEHSEIIHFYSSLKLGNVSTKRNQRVEWAKARQSVERQNMVAIAAISHLCFAIRGRSEHKSWHLNHLMQPSLRPSPQNPLNATEIEMFSKNKKFQDGEIKMFFLSAKWTMFKMSLIWFLYIVYQDWITCSENGFTNISLDVWRPSLCILP